MSQAPALFSKEWAIAATKEIKQTNENWQYFLEVIELEARKKKANFDALKAQGFTEEQCIQLIR